MTTTTTRYCTACDDDVLVDVATWACLRCGKVTGFAPEAEGQPPRRAEIDTLADRLLADAVARENASRTLLDEAERLRRAASILRAADVDYSPQERPSGGPQRGRPRLDRWATDYDACTNCGRTNVRHAAHGLCVTCTMRVRAGKPLDKPVRSYRRVSQNRDSPQT